MRPNFLQRPTLWLRTPRQTSDPVNDAGSVQHYSRPHDSPWSFLLALAIGIGLAVALAHWWSA